MAFKKLLNLSTPTEPFEAATKKYVDDVVATKKYVDDKDAAMREYVNSKREYYCGERCSRQSFTLG